jgi:hypothetical protein
MLRCSPAFKKNQSVALQYCANDFRPNQDPVIPHPDCGMMMLVCECVEHGHVPHSNLQLEAGLLRHTHISIACEYSHLNQSAHVQAHINESTFMLQGTRPCSLSFTCMFVLRRCATEAKAGTCCCCHRSCISRGRTTHHHYHLCVLWKEIEASTILGCTSSMNILMVRARRGLSREVHTGTYDSAPAPYCSALQSDPVNHK